MFKNYFSSAPFFRLHPLWSILANPESPTEDTIPQIPRTPNQAVVSNRLEDAPFLRAISSVKRSVGFQPPINSKSTADTVSEKLTKWSECNRSWY